MVSVVIDLTQVTDWPSFHRGFAAALGFPAFYGANMNAWVDCMSDLSGPDVAGMTAVQVPRGEHLLLELQGSLDLRNRLPEIFSALTDAVAWVNRGKVAIPGATRLLLLLL